MERGGLIYRVRGSRLAADSTHPDTARGWLFAALRWDIKDLSPPNLPIEGRLSLVPPDQAGQPAADAEPVRIERILRDFTNRPIRVLRQDYLPSEVVGATSTDWLELLVLAAFGLITIGLLAFCLVRWVILPAGALRRSLLHRDQQALATLLARGGYVSELAQLIGQSLETQNRLEQTLADRARLGRELHDGVIQTIYAAGMGLAGARATLRENPAEAERVLDDTKTELNATIVDLRSFIKGLESDESSRRKFSEAVHSLTGLMQFSRAVHFVIEIDDVVADRLPADERMQLLQIVREAASNAVRHSSANLVTIRLQTTAEGVVLEINDNGSGFDPAVSIEAGHGLANFQARAQELGGSITVTSCPHGGSQVKLRLAGHS
jgi:signal transduction histidine kinase